MTIRAVVFDVGETLVNETREYGTWADWLNVPRHTFAAVFGAVIATGRDYRETFEVFAPGFDLTAQRLARTEAGKPEWFGEDDLYGDVRTGLADLRAAGTWVGVAGNQTVRAGELLRQLQLPTDFVGTSDDWGVQKPAVEFFEKVFEAVPVQDPSEVLYVGDRLDNDIRPAKQFGMRTAFIRRGPWGWIQQDDPGLDVAADYRIDSIAELVDIVRSSVVPQAVSEPAQTRLQ